MDLGKGVASSTKVDSFYRYKFSEIISVLYLDVHTVWSTSIWAVWIAYLSYISIFKQPDRWMRDIQSIMFDKSDYNNEKKRRRKEGRQYRS